MIMEQALNSSTHDLMQDMWSDRLELLRRRINDEDYLHAAIQRLALVLSKELMEMTLGGARNERQRKRRK
ncbi:MAG: hypothetical protein LBH16_01780 [Treponema sp.]|jgi:hypothetical protein|nr:hypothetical protein [Treponema sp.]